MGMMLRYGFIFIDMFDILRLLSGRFWFNLTWNNEKSELKNEDCHIHEQFAHSIFS